MAKRGKAASSNTPAGAVVLLLENDPGAFDATAAVLRAADCTVLHAPTAVDALDVLRGPKRVDVFLVTIDIAGQPSGFTVARMARLRRPELPVLYLRNGALADSRAAAPALGPILQKPVAPASLVAAVNAAIAAGSKPGRARAGPGLSFR